MTKKTFRTKQAILLDAFKNIVSTLYLDIDSVVFDFEKYTANVCYYYIDENGNKVELIREPARFSITEGRGIQDATGPLNGTYLDQMFVDIITKATMVQFDMDHYFGTSSSTWELYEAATD